MTKDTLKDLRKQLIPEIRRRVFEQMTNEIANIESKKFTWSRGGGYECSSKGDQRYSAFWARLSDGRTIEEHYQCDIKGYDPGGTNWRKGKGKPSLRKDVDLWSCYLNLWRDWANVHFVEMIQLASLARKTNWTLSDVFAKTSVNQAHALATILNEWIDSGKLFTLELAYDIMIERRNNKDNICHY